ncbi:acetoin reductase [Corynebacterium pacaense]|uniref:acetoin reductase n=1 Tax=Corynebacterium pacaense TaxID=1816684 RepID=UPI0009BA956E|nr:acetoin reductase [Corynebacterium pacaense]
MSKVALITGAAQGIGRAIATKLAEDGFDIAIADLPFQEEVAAETIAAVEAAGHRAIFIGLNVADKANFDAAVDEAAEKLGGFDVLVNNAGIAQVKPVLEVTQEDLEKIYPINVYSVFYGIQAAARKFDELGVKGKIVNAASIAAIQGFPILGTYSTTKFAVRGLTQVAAQELAPKGHTVNAYAPGIVGTGMWELIDEELSKINGKPKGQNFKEQISGIALGRTSEPRDVAGVVSFLASENSDYVTGQVILVDGGMLYN